MSDIVLTIGGISLIPIIVIAVEIAKNLGLPVKYAPYLNGVLTVVGYLLVQLATAKPELQPSIVSILTVIVVFLSASGFYDEVIKPAKARFNNR